MAQLQTLVASTADKLPNSDNCSNALCHWQLGMLRCVGAINKLMMQLHQRSVEPPCSEGLMRCALEVPLVNSWLADWPTGRLAGWLADWTV